MLDKRIIIAVSFSVLAVGAVIAVALTLVSFGEYKVLLKICPISNLGIKMFKKGVF